MTEERQGDLEEKLLHIRRDAEERDASRRASSTGAPYIDLRKIPVSIDALKLVPEKDARAARAATVQMKPHEVALAAYDAASPKVKKIVETLVGDKLTVKLFTSSASGLEEAWKMYRFVSNKAADITGTLEISAVESLIPKLSSLRAVREEVEKRDLKKVTTTELFHVVLAGALATKASDIHCETEEKAAKVRYRLDGLLHDVVTDLPQKNYDALISRIKLLAGLKINIHGEPQDGRFTIELSTKEVEIRVSIIPSEFGETVVMRVLDPEAIMVGFDSLGLRKDDQNILEHVFNRPNGLLLNTGPTGSGKTTTLYACLRRMASSEVKIITIEDPIEYRLTGIEQTQTNPEVGYTFSSGLRAILRQDPNVILVGEIRDLETADIALQAALTGHLVLSTLHTNDAAGAVPRLVDLGVKAETIGPALTLVVAQRLVRKLCASCRARVEIPDALSKNIEAFLKRLPSRVDKSAYKNITVFKSVGCASCNDTGYNGRTGVYEFLEGGSEIERAIIKSASTETLREIARAQHMVTMQEDGLLKVIAGTTSFDEVERVTGEISWLNEK